MATIRDRLFDITTLPSSPGVLYANPSATKTFFSGFVLHNTAATAQVVKLYNVPDSTGSVGTAVDTGAGANRILKIELQPDETFILPPPPNGIVLQDLNDSIQGSATSANTVTITPQGVKDA